MPVKYTHNKFYLMFNHACLITTETSEQAGNVGRTSRAQGCSRRIHEPWVPCDRLPFFLGNFILSFKNPKGKTLMPSHIFMYLFIYIYICISMNEWCVYIVLCVLLYTQGAFQSQAGGGGGGGGLMVVSSTTIRVQHPLGWCDSSHSTTAPVRSPHTSNIYIYIY